jgi:hypothetical protein
MRTRIIIVFAAFLTLFSTGCSKDSKKSNPAVIEDMLVKNNEITGWAYSGAGWIANNGTELTTQIDGGAELFIKYNFSEGAYQMYTGVINSIDCELQLYVYNQGSASSAISLFDDPDLGFSSAITWTDNPAGTKAKYERYSGLSQVLGFYRDKYFVHLNISFDSEESLNILKQFAYNVDEKLKNALK